MDFNPVLLNFLFYFVKTVLMPNANKRFHTIALFLHLSKVLECILHEKKTHIATRTDVSAQAVVIESYRYCFALVLHRFLQLHFLILRCSMKHELKIKRKPTLPVSRTISSNQGTLRVYQNREMGVSPFIPFEQDEVFTIPCYSKSRVP